MTDRPVVLVGDPDDREVAALRQALRDRDCDPVVFDTLRFPGSTRVSAGAPLEAITVDGTDVGRPGSVWTRQMYLHPLSFGVDVSEDMDDDWRTTLVQFREKAEMLVGVVRRWETLGVPVYNPMEAGGRVRKPWQMALLDHAGLPVPETLWTNDPEAVRAFADGRRVAYKPIAGGAATQMLEPDDLTDERLEALAHAPVTFQELLPGDDIRVFVLDGAVVAAYRIETAELDFRGHEQKVETIPLDDDTADICLRATEVIGLRWTGMDLKAAEDGRPRILELNPAPMFVGFDRLAGTDLTGTLADALLTAAATH